MPDEPSGSGWREHLLLLGRFLRSPRTIGAVAPSSRALACEMVRDLDLRGPVRVVELGPGTGAFTRAIVERLGPNARCLVVEIEPAFVQQIRARWPSIECVCASAATLERLVAERAFGPVDHVISGLPFASLPKATTREILAALARTLRPGGTFTTFQYVHAYPLPAAVAFRREINARLGSLPQRRLVLPNVPPAWVLTWRTGTTGAFLVR
jgi:phosphatidylethanolamine/phosphatidyl-N-methylethanolamine N-methyltransferase